MPVASHIGVDASSSLYFVVGVTKPNHSNTGAGVIRPYPTGQSASYSVDPNLSGTQIITGATFNCDVTLSGSAALYDCIIHGTVTCKGSANIVENCVIDFKTGYDYNGGSGSDVWAIQTNKCTARAQLRFNTIFGRLASYSINGIGARHYYAYRNNISAVVDGFSMYTSSSSVDDTDALAEANFVYELQYNSPDPNHGSGSNTTHNDALQIQGGSGTMHGNTLWGNWSPTVGTGNNPAQLYELSAVMVNQNTNTTQLTLTSNWFDYGVYCLNAGGAGTATILCTNNKFGPNYLTQAYVVQTQAALTESGNIYEASGLPITAKRYS